MAADIKSEKVVIDFNDWSSILKAMKNYSTIDYPLNSTNQDGERQLISIWSDKIIVRTFQSNGWTRINTYHDDYTTEETFEK